MASDPDADDYEIVGTFLAYGNGVKDLPAKGECEIKLIAPLSAWPILSEIALSPAETFRFVLAKPLRPQTGAATLHVVKEAE